MVMTHHFSNHGVLCLASSFGRLGHAIFCCICCLPFCFISEPGGDQGRFETKPRIDFVKVLSCESLFFPVFVVPVEDFDPLFDGGLLLGLILVVSTRSFL